MDEQLEAGSMDGTGPPAGEAAISAGDPNPMVTQEDDTSTLGGDEDFAAGGVDGAEGDYEVGVRENDGDPFYGKDGCVARAQRMRQYVQDNVDAILAKREKKISIPIPETPVTQFVRQRVCYLKEEDMEHLLHEIKGTKYGSSCRPELTLIQLPQPGDTYIHELVLDQSKSLFILSESSEDRLLRSIKLHRDAIAKSDVGLIFSSDDITYYPTDRHLVKRLWRRFLMNYLVPKSEELDL